MGWAGFEMNRPEMKSKVVISGVGRGEGERSVYELKTSYAFCNFIFYFIFCCFAKGDWREREGFVRNENYAGLGGLGGRHQLFEEKHHDACIFFFFFSFLFL